MRGAAVVKNPMFVWGALVLLMVIVAAAILAFSFYDNDQNGSTQPPDSFSAWQGTHFGLTEETETKIKQDYLSFDVSREPYSTAEDVVLYNYYGTYGGCVAATMGYGYYSYSTMITHENIDGITISYPNSNKILVWNDGNFCHLQEAYDNSLLTKDDIIRISEIWPLFWSEEKQIRQNYVDTFIRQYVPEATADGVWIELNYGRYYNPTHVTVVLMMWHEEEGTTCAIREVYLGNVKFIYSNGYSITAWNDGYFYGLQDAYDQNFLTMEDIINISKLHKASYSYLYDG